jgi:hypothetical protein
MGMPLSAQPIHLMNTPTLVSERLTEQFGRDIIALASSSVDVFQQKTRNFNRTSNTPASRLFFALYQPQPCENIKKGDV